MTEDQAPVDIPLECFWTATLLLLCGLQGNLVVFAPGSQVFRGAPGLGLTVGSALEAHWQASESSIPLSKKATRQQGAEAEGLDQLVVGQMATS